MDPPATRRLAWRLQARSNVACRCNRRVRNAASPRRDQDRRYRRFAAVHDDDFLWPRLATAGTNRPPRGLSSQDRKGKNMIALHEALEMLAEHVEVRVAPAPLGPELPTLSGRAPVPDLRCVG